MRYNLCKALDTALRTQLMCNNQYLKKKPKTMTQIVDWHCSKTISLMSVSTILRPKWLTAGSSLAVQCLWLCAFTAEGAGSIPNRGTRILQVLQQLLTVITVVITSSSVHSWGSGQKKKDCFGCFALTNKPISMVEYIQW